MVQLNLFLEILFISMVQLNLFLEILLRNTFKNNFNKRDTFT